MALVILVYINTVTAYSDSVKRQAIIIIVKLILNLLGISIRVTEASHILYLISGALPEMFQLFPVYRNHPIIISLS